MIFKKSKTNKKTTSQTYNKYIRKIKKNIADTRKFFDIDDDEQCINQLPVPKEEDDDCNNGSPEYLTFDKVLNKLKDGYKFTRVGWHTKNVFIYYVPAGAYPPCTDVGQSIVNDVNLVIYQPYIAFKTSYDTVVPWVASQSDLLADDYINIK